MDIQQRQKNKSQQLSRYDSIDGARLIMALLVAVLHVGMPLGFCSKYLCDIARIAVPFFFMCTGFFIYNSDPLVVRKRIKKSIKKTFSFLISTSIIYLILELLLWHNPEKVLQELTQYVSFDTLFFNSVPFMPVGWYLMALIYALVVISVLMKFNNKPNWVNIALIILCLVYTLLTGVYQNFIFKGNVFSLKYNCCWIAALPWILIGMYMSYMQITNKMRLSNAVLSLCVVVGIVACLAEHYIIKKCTGTNVTGTLYAGTILSALCIFLLLCQNRAYLRRLAPLGRQYSSNIYFYHVAWNYILCAFFGVRFVFANKGGVITLPFNYSLLINCFTTSLLASVFPILVNKIRNGIKRHLHQSA